ncbi:MAG: ACP S-malonyltransferase [Dehalococcoidia bacterium]|nr:[acyl-carrier-protein] S-malonyltransferase [Chloroflexota bacterium]RZP13250.1 MAG: [acyl-carrier-protein] S-malonyltransferase [Chloroflexota bacterium]|tara:strand:+ start:17288 stop:18223 length:936 start_codon:yes stop_codon:yes gene_type:complete
MKNEKVAFLFPGQASQAPGMGLDLYKNSMAAREVFQEADEILGRKLSEVIFEGTKEELTRTENAQPSIATVSIAAWRAIESEMGSIQIPNFTAGHSLGEYSSLATAGALSIKETIDLVSKRGELMEKACNDSPGGMSAIIGIDSSSVKEVCEETGTYLSNINTSNQIIIAGKKENLVNAMDLASRLGAKKAIPLPVAGAFHSALMSSAQQELNSVIDDANFEDAVVPIVANTSAEAITDKGSLRDELKTQLQNCVLWSDSINYMIEEKVETFYEIGPGSVLSGMLKRIDSNLNVKNIGNYNQVLDYVEARS